MEKEIHDFWTEHAAMREADKLDALRKVLDPNDRKGVKNRYLDAYLKHYVLQYLSPCKEDVLLEVGCGIGRLTEFLSPIARTVYGIDLVDGFIDACSANPAKGDNTCYLKLKDLDLLKQSRINKMYMVWVLMYLIDEMQVIQTLRQYREHLPHLSRCMIIEQVTTHSQTIMHDGKLHCRYYTLQDYTDIFASAGFRLTDYHVLGERTLGPVYNTLRAACNLVPRKVAGWSDRLFLLDRCLVGSLGSRRLINDVRPTDVAFVLEVA